MGLNTVSSALSVFIWGIVMAKAKSGFSVAGSKDAATVKSTVGSIITMSVLIALASLAKLNADNHYIENFVGQVN